MSGREEELAEFTGLSAKVSARTATPEEVARWRELRGRLVAPAPATPAGLKPRAARSTEKLRIMYVPISDLKMTFTEEISSGGVRIRTQRRFDVGALMLLRIELSKESEPLTTVGRVAWSRQEESGFYSGVELISLRSDEKERIEAHALATKPPK